ncbi:MAG: hypothetical protein HY954_04150 [Deltaproteobacteria bacterium]|nr:hypothetical protein [Deltaproteobacteria bacterium]
MMITLNSFEKGVKWRPFLSTRGKTYPAFTSREAQQGFKRLTHRVDNGTLFIPVDLPVALPPFSALALPELNAPVALWPQVGLLADEELKLFIKGVAKAILALKPGIEMRWENRTDVVTVAIAMTTRLMEELNDYGSTFGEGIRVYVGGCDGSSLRMVVETNTDILPLVYMREKKTLEEKAERISGLFDEAVRLLGTFCLTWMDIRSEAMEFYEWNILPELETPGYYDDEQIKQEREYYEALKSCYQNTRFFLSRKGMEKRLERFRRKVLKFEPESEVEEKCRKWFMTVIELLEDDMATAIREIYENGFQDDCLDPKYMFPILYDVENDAVTDFYERTVNESLQSGASIGVVCDLEIPLKKTDTGMEVRISNLKHVLRVLARLCRVFGFSAD